MLSYFTILGTCVLLWLPICVSKLQCLDPCAPLVINMCIYITMLGSMCTYGYQYVYLHYNVGIQVVVEFPIYFHSWIPGYQYAVLFHNLGNLCAPFVTNNIMWIPGYQYAVLFHNLGNLCAPFVTNNIMCI